MIKRKGLLVTHDSTHGFTLLELLISLAIFSMVAAIVYATLTLGARAAERGEVQSTENQRTRAVVALITRQLKSAYPFALQNQGETVVYFFGEPQELSFISAAGRPETGGLEKVTYFLRADQEGRLSLWVRTSAPVLPTDMLNQREGSLRQETLVVPAVETIKWEYLMDTQSTEGGKLQREEKWLERWDGSKEYRLPTAVRLSWKARLGDLPYEWQLEVPVHVFFPSPDILATLSGGGAGARRRRLRGRAEEE